MAEAMVAQLAAQMSQLTELLMNAEKMKQEGERLRGGRRGTTTQGTNRHSQTTGNLPTSPRSNSKPGHSDRHGPNTQEIELRNTIG